MSSVSLALVLFGGPAVAAADQPAQSKSSDSVEQTASADPAAAQHSQTSQREQPMILGSDYVMGRYVLPLVVGVAVAFALVLLVVFRTEAAVRAVREGLIDEPSDST